MPNHKKKKRISLLNIFRILLVLSIIAIPSFILFYKLTPKPSTNFSIISPLDSLTNAPEEIIKPKEVGAYLGVSTLQASTSEIDDLEEKIGLNFKIVNVYSSWGGENKSFNLNWANYLDKKGKIPMITWEPWNPVSGYDRSENIVKQDEYLLKNITSGKFDDYIISFAMDIKTFRKPVMIRFAHEMNGNWYSWGSTFNTPDEYVLAWRHVHELFKEVGAFNVTWVWSPNAIYIEPKVPFADKIDKFYPGNEYVDWVGFSSFNWAGKYKQNIYQNPKELYPKTVKSLEKYAKPIIITETASADTGNIRRRSEWIKLLATYLKETPQIKGVVWFNIQDQGIDWRIDSNQESINSFKNSFDSYFLE